MPHNRTTLSKRYLKRKNVRSGMRSYNTATDNSKVLSRCRWQNCYNSFHFLYKFIKKLNEFGVDLKTAWKFSWQAKGNYELTLESKALEANKLNSFEINDNHGTITNAKNLYIFSAIIFMLKMLFLTLISLNLFFCENITVEISDGKIKGQIRSQTGPLSGKTVEYAEFIGIPYAEPPVGKLRFLPPQKLAPWKPQTLLSKKKPLCAQSAEWDGFGKWKIIKFIHYESKWIKF